uniref:Uncharacterized protein n=1 Tax=Arundo donax TaxID=35708 RepID=A0A0A9A0J4_ARUDO
MKLPAEGHDLLSYPLSVHMTMQWKLKYEVTSN